VVEETKSYPETLMCLSETIFGKEWCF